MSPLLSRLNDRLANTSNPDERAEIQVRRACYLARIGAFSDARSLVLELRREFNDGHNALISAWIMLAEGLIEIFENMSPRAKDRIARAQLISIAIKSRTLGAIASSWKAHIDFETSDFGGMINSLKLAIEYADSDNHDAHARLGMIIAGAMYLCGDRESAQSWFMKSRSHALDAGDQASIDALIYNRAAFSMSWLRSERCFGPQDASVIALVKLEIASSRNFQGLARIGALNHFVDLCEARILILSNDYEGALSILRKVRGAGPFADYNFSVDIVDLEISYCLQMMGRVDEALEIFTPTAGLDFSMFDVDDRLVVAWMRMQLSLSDSRFGDAEKMEADFELIGKEYKTMRDELSVAIKSIASK
jgi:tetratricopeptide (TPR) repeat protein